MLSVQLVWVRRFVYFEYNLPKQKFNESVNFIFNSSWMMQFWPGHRENIVCRRDGTLRYSEPSAGESALACIIPFILSYYFLIAACVWFAIFTYAWYLQTTDRGIYSYQPLRSTLSNTDSSSFFL